MSEFSEEDDARFPSELVGRPTSDVLRYLADTFQKYARDTAGVEGPSCGYHYAHSWLVNWMRDAEKVEDERRRRAR